MKRVLSYFLVMAVSVLTASAQGEKTKIEVKPYGFVRNYAAFDTRACSSGTQDLYFFCPKDVAISEAGVDLNAIPSYRMLALTSRLGLNVTGFQFGGMKLSAKIEADFYNMNKSTAVFRLRQAYVDLNWTGLWNREQNALSFLVGQTWHPMAKDMPYVLSLETGAPFGPFARSPQMTLNLDLGRNLTLTGSLLYQMQYLSTGPKGKVQDYIKYSLVPELYLGAEFKNGGFTAKLGVDMLNIKPRIVDEPSGVKVSDRLLTVSPFAYFKYSSGDFSINGKTIFAEAGEHMNLLSGYGVSKINDDHSREYTPMRSTASFVSLKYGRKLQFMASFGYMKLLGTKDPLYSEFSEKSEPDFSDQWTGKEYYYFNSATTSNINQMFRVTPTLAYNWSKLSLGLEYNMSTAQYGTYVENQKVSSKNGLVENDLHWVTNHRILLMLKYMF